MSGPSRDDEGRVVRVKVCGITTPGDALEAVALGADFLGLNFWPPSPRAVTIERAREIAAAVRGARLGRAGGSPVGLVGVFVDRARDEVAAIDAAVGLDLLQFHGHEPAEAIAPWAARALKVFRVRGEAAAGTVRDFARRLDVWGYLFDHDDPVRHGGSGRGWRYESLRALERETGGRPVFVAGGLRPGTVGAAVRAASPWGVDVCSGVESAPGTKDPELLRRFFQEIQDVRHAQSALAT